MKKSLKDVYKNLLKENKKRKIKSNSNQLLEQELGLQHHDFSNVEPSDGFFADYYSSSDSKILEDYFTEYKFDKMCEKELQKAIDGLELIDDTALRLDYMINAFAAENRLIERELRAAENRRERNRGAADNASWWK